jgi:hypothetical protein
MFINVCSSCCLLCLFLPLNLDACLSTVLKNGTWNWKPARSYALVEIQGRFPKVKLGACDTPV